MRVCVVGVGRMGLAVAVQFANAGAEVVGCDVDADLVEQINAGAVDTGDEPGLAEGLRRAVDGGTLRATTHTARAVASAQAVVVLVRMVASSDGCPDYTDLDAATAAIGVGLQPGTLVVYETTVPVGDTRGRFAPVLARASSLQAGADFRLCFSPERVSSGSILRDLATYPKIVGGLTGACADAGADFYSRHLPATVWRLSSLEAAEFTKVAETTYRDVNIALANEFARYADQVGVDILEVVRSANSQPYSHIHQPGVGVGGHCIPVYPHFFMTRARDARLVTAARRINEEMPAYAASRLEAMLEGLEGRRVLILGLAFRAGVAEASHSVAIPLRSALLERGADVRVHDSLLGRSGVESTGLPWGEPAEGWAEGAVLQAAHGSYLSLRPQEMPGLRALVDGRGVLDLDVWRQAGVLAAGIGRPSGG